ncbi:MAG: hypothetical protein SGJ10_14725 [Bacteroidota bacterium]|nr:hypothetical protein [Bacteroidota bacterium]
MPVENKAQFSPLLSRMKNTCELKNINMRDSGETEIEMKRILFCY